MREHRSNSSPLNEQLNRDRQAWVLATIASGIVILWAAVTLLFEQVRFAAVTPEGRIAVESAAAFGSLFVALVLTLFPTENAGRRLRWVASAFLMLGVGALAFGVLP